MARRVMALVAATALALQLMLPMPQPAAAAPNAADICHFDPAAHHHDGKHDTPSGRAGCDWCMLCGKLGTAVGPLDQVAVLPQRVALPIVVGGAVPDVGHHIGRPRTGHVGARAPPGIV